MADRSAIQWTDATWNPIVGCSVVSPGCTNCYAMKMAARIENIDAGKRLKEFSNHRHMDDDHPTGNSPNRTALLNARTHYAGTTLPDKAVWSGKVVVAPTHILTQPLRWRRPRRIFVNSMGDLFHESVPDAWVDRVFAVMALCPQHTFQVLTKRSARMRAYACDVETPRRIAEIILFESGSWGVKGEQVLAPLGNLEREEDPSYVRWPLPNVWLGVSAEDQRRADERVPDLLATPAAIRFASCEPLLGPVRLHSLNERSSAYPAITDWHDALRGLQFGCRQHETERLDWVIAGGESGPHARPMHPDWARALRDGCAAVGVPFFFKQWGEWEVAVDRERDDPDWRLNYSSTFADAGKTKWLNLAGGCGFHGEGFHVMRRVGKARAGRLLDGLEHNALPEGKTA